MNWVVITTVQWNITTKNEADFLLTLLFHSVFFAVVGFSRCPLGLECAPSIYFIWNCSVQFSLLLLLHFGLRMLNVELVKYLNAISQVYHAHFNTCTTWSERMSEWERPNEVHTHAHACIQQWAPHIYSARTDTWISNSKKCTPTLKISSTGMKTHFSTCRLWVLVVVVIVVVVVANAIFSVDAVLIYRQIECKYMLIWNSKSNS